MSASEPRSNRKGVELSTLPKSPGPRRGRPPRAAKPAKPAPAGEVGDDWLAVVQSEPVEPLHRPVGRSAKADVAPSHTGAAGDSLRAYMRKIAAVRLLTREGEVEVSRRIEDARLARGEVAAWRRPSSGTRSCSPDSVSGGVSSARDR